MEESERQFFSVGICFILVPKDKDLSNFKRLSWLMIILFTNQYIFLGVSKRHDFHRRKGYLFLRPGLNYALAARGWSVSVWDDLALVDGADEKTAFLYDQGGMAETAETGRGRR